MDAHSSYQMHIIIFPWLAFGHMLPSLELANRLASRGHLVSFVSTPRNISGLPSPVSSLVKMVALQLPRLPGLAEGSESTKDVPQEKWELLWQAFDGLEEAFSGLLSGKSGKQKPDWVILDIFHHWATAAAMEHKVPSAALLLGSASVVASMIGVRSDPTEPPKFETERNKLLNTTQPASAMSIGQRCFMTLKSCNILAMRSCLEWEPESVPLVAKLHGKPVVPLGLMPPSHRGLKSNDTSLAWLDNQPANSVIYVALGSEVPLPVAHVHELALGLELAGTRFLWALRKPSAVPEADILPPGFEGRTRHLGLVTTGWVPQTSLLTHRAVAVFFTHCGWNSIIEGLLFGRPLVMLPIYGDQGPNARMMEKRNVGVQVPRDENDGSFHRQGVATAVSSVMAENGMFAANAKKLQEIVSDSKCHERYIDGLIQQLTCYNVDTE